MAWVVSSPNAQSWTTSASATQVWQSAAEPSAASRPNHVFPSRGSSGVDFQWRIRSEFPWYVATGNHVQIVSALTHGAP